jgi:hypothetical protein
MHGFPHKSPRPVESPQRLSLDGQASLLSNNVFAYVVRSTESKLTARGFGTVSNSPSPLDTAISGGACH